MPSDPNALVAMTHPDVHVGDEFEPAEVTQAAYDQVWQAKGWVLVGTVDRTGNITPVAASNAASPTSWASSTTSTTSTTSKEG